MNLSDYPNLEFLTLLENPGERRIDPKALKREIDVMFADYRYFTREREAMESSLLWHSKEKIRLEKIIDDLQADLSSANRAVHALTNSFHG